MQCSPCTMAQCGLVLVVIAFVILAPNLCGVLQKTGTMSASVSRNEWSAVKRHSVPDQQTSRDGRSAGDFNHILKCGPDESCAARCGSPASESAEYRCFCDHRCTFFKDCCMDFNELCSSPRLGDTEVSGFDSLTSPSPVPGDSDDSGLQSHVNFDCVGIEEFTGGTVWMKSACDPTWTDSRMAELCANVDSGDTLARLPVQGNDGFTYRNMYCAQCNFAIVNVIYWIGLSACYEDPPSDAGTNMASLANYLRTSCRTLVDEPKIKGGATPRFCLQNVDWCNPESAAEIGGGFLELATLCNRGYQGLVRGHSDTGDTAIYKNPFCALCNGIQNEEMSCDVPTLTRYSEDVSYYDYFDDADTLNSRRAAGDLQKPSCVVITNFNFRNSSNVMILRTDGSNEFVPVSLRCPDHEVYDPYIGECRPTYCAVGYTLSENQCVREKPPTWNMSGSIEMTFSITVKFTWFFDENGDPADPIPFIHGNYSEYNFTDSRDEVSSRSFVISKTNVTMALSEVVEFQGILDPTSQNLTLDDASKFWLSLLTFDVQALQVIVAGSVLNIDSDNVEDFIRSLKGNTWELASFLAQCPDGVKNVYSTDQLIVKHDEGGCLSVQVKNTSASYRCSSWLFLKQTYSQDGSQDGHFLTAVACEDDTAVLDPSCVRIQYGISECAIENATVICTNGKRYGPGEYETAADGRIFACSDFGSVIETKYVVLFNFTRAQNIIALVGVGLSTACLSATLFTYAMFKELRTLPGMNLMTLAVILLTNDWTFVFGLYATDNKIACRAVGIFLHFVCLCQFFWVNVIAYDVYKTFGRKRITKLNMKISQRKQYCRYALFAWGMPVLIVGISATLDFCDCTFLDVDYGQYFSCWISDPAAYSIFFGIPMVVSNVANLIMFVVTVCNLRCHHRKSAVISGNTNTHNDFALCAKLATVMGFAWNLAFVASILHNAVLWYFFFVFYFLQGFFMSLSYIFNRRVYRMYLKKFGRDRLPSVTSVAPPNARSRPPSVASQIPSASPSPRSSEPTSLSVYQDLRLLLSSKHLMTPDNQPGTSLDPPPRSHICRQRSNSCSVAHISGTDNFDSIPGTVLPPDASRRKRRVSFNDGIRHLRTSSVDGASFYTNASTTSDVSYASPLRTGHLDLGIANLAFSSSDEFSSDDDDVFQPAYYFTQC